VNNWHCQKCGEEITEKNLSKDMFKGKSELGLDLIDHMYVCPKCGAKHIVCPECQGWSYGMNEKNFYDCELCSGMGMILTEKICNGEDFNYNKEKK